MLGNITKKLSLFGGEPRFDEILPVCRPVKPDKAQLKSFLSDIIDRDYYTNDGPLVNQLETQLCEYLSVKNCVVLSSGTSGIELALRALNLKGEVIVPSFTFIASAGAISWQGLVPVFCDVNPVTHTLCLEHCRSLINEKTSAIMAVNLWGNISDVRAIESLGLEFDIPVIFDSAHAFGCGIEQGLAGGFGSAEIFSFHATKPFHTGEGGAVTTNDDDLANQVRSIRNFGFTNYNETSCLGTNAKMSEIHAAMGLVNLAQFQNTVKKAKKTHKRYSQNLKNIIGISVLNYDKYDKHNYHYVVLEIDPICRINRDLLYEILRAEKVDVRKYFYPGCHLMSPFNLREKIPSLPTTELLAKKVLVLPGGANITFAEIDTVSQIVIETIDNASELVALYDQGVCD